MASIEVGPLSNNIDDEEISMIQEAFEDADIELALDEDAESRLINGNLDETFFDSFLDQLDAANIACDIYVPSDFEDIIEVGDFKIGSASALLMVLDELRDELFDSDDDDENSEFGDFDDEADQPFRHSSAGDGPASDATGDYKRYLWEALASAARHCISDHTGMYVRR